MDLKTFMERTGVKRKSTVDKWLREGYIPGAFINESTNEWEFPDSSRRPHAVHLKPNADANKIRASMVYACIKRHHISAQIYKLGESEFNALIADLVSAGLIEIRKDGIYAYYDSTHKCQKYRGRTYSQIAIFVRKCLEVTTEAAVKGLAMAIIESSGNNTAAA